MIDPILRSELMQCLSRHMQGHDQPIAGPLLEAAERFGKLNEISSVAALYAFQLTISKLLSEHVDLTELIVMATEVGLSGDTVLLGTPPVGRA